MADPVSIISGLGGLFLGKSKSPSAPPSIPTRDDPEVQRKLQEERRRSNRLRGRASLILSQPTLSAPGAGLASKELLGG